MPMTISAMFGNLHSMPKFHHVPAHVQSLLMLLAVADAQPAVTQTLVTRLSCSYSFVTQLLTSADRCTPLLHACQWKPHLQESCVASWVQATASTLSTHKQQPPLLTASARTCQQSVSHRFVEHQPQHAHAAVTGHISGPAGAAAEGTAVRTCDQLPAPSAAASADGDLDPSSCAQQHWLVSGRSFLCAPCGSVWSSTTSDCPAFKAARSTTDQT
jgi:hypothetical protein